MRAERWVPVRFAGALVVALGVLCAVALPASARGPLPEEVALAQLPREARDTLTLIRKGGRFPYERDGIVFGNYEQRLPQQPRGYYREFTVPTPGVKHRGARRIVAGGCERARAPCSSSEFYYSGDHYHSFQRIVE